MIQVTLSTNEPRIYDIVPETMTVRQLLEKHSVSYANAQTSIDGFTLQLGQMDTPLGELLGGNADRCTVSCFGNKDNGAQAVIAGASCIIKSRLTPDEIKRVKKLHPEAMTMVDEEGKPVFAIDINDETPGSINNFGACFGAATSSDGKATITVNVQPDVENMEDFVYEKIGKALSCLSELEDGIVEAMPQMDEEERAVRAMITRI